MNDPHADGRVLLAGVALGDAVGVVILLHGRGASAEDILSVSGAIGVEGLAYLAPQAYGSEWYPNSFLAPVESNEPGLGSALKKVESLVGIVLDAGVAREKIVIAGFSQGACLATEFLATRPARYGGMIAWTGGLMGPVGSEFNYAGDLAGTPVFQSSGDPDPHVPWVRVEESAGVLRAMGAVVTTRRYPGKPHSVSGEEIALGRTLIEEALGVR